MIGAAFCVAGVFCAALGLGVVFLEIVSPADVLGRYIGAGGYAIGAATTLLSNIA